MKFWIVGIQVWFCVVISKGELTHNSPVDHEQMDLLRRLIYEEQKPAKESIGEPLILTPLIADGKMKQAREQARVKYAGFNDTVSYAGFLTVNKSCDSNLFFWFFPAEESYETAPVMLWLNGGPGLSSFVGLLTENGPIRVVDSNTFEKSEYYWSKYHSMLYIDNPAGVGFSFTKKGCYPTEQTQIGREMYNALIQFFDLFSELQQNEFYLSGESYAGKYLPSIGHTIHQNNPTAKLKINLKGLIIGNGLFDPVNQHRYSNYLFELGFVDNYGKILLEIKESNFTTAILSKNWELASSLYDDLILRTNLSLYYNLTGLNTIYNFVLGDDEHRIIVSDFMSNPEIRSALHVGQVEYNVSSPFIQKSLSLDRAKSIAPYLSELLEHYQIYMYNGQLDIILTYTLARQALNALAFRGKEDFENAERQVWHVEDEVAGYIRSGGNLTLAMVRNAGHMVPKNQPKFMMDLLLKFTKANLPRPK